MAQKAIAACPRCGAKPRVSARFCSRCGLDLPTVEGFPSAVGRGGVANPPPYVAPPPPQYPPPQHYPPTQFPPQNYPPNVQPRPAPPPKKSGSGCGCLLAFLILVGIIAAIGRFGSSSKPASPKAADAVSFESLFGSSMPSRPMSPFYPPSPPLGPFTYPVMNDCLVESSRSGSDNVYSIRATVGPGSHGRVKMAVFLLDSFGYSVASRDYKYGNSDGTLCTGAWVNGPDQSEGGHYASTSTTSVRLTIPMSSARSTVSSAQFSLFSEDGVELARQTMPLHNLTPPGYHEPKR